MSASRQPPSSKGDAKHKGTLACVVLKAKNLPNKKSIGKQDPFAVLSIDSDKQRTKADRRGGQHPTWDEQLHFEIYNEPEAASASSKEAGSSKPSSSKNKKILKVACYAEDSKEPLFIGEALVDLTGVLKTGEFDEWVTLKSKERYCGEVYLELTFFSSARPPRRSRPTKSAYNTAAGTYGGAGTFSAVDGEAAGIAQPGRQQAYPGIPSSMRPGPETVAGHGRLSSSTSTTYADPGLPLRPSSSMASMATYTPAYAPPAIQRITSPQPPGQGLPSSATMPVLDRPETQSMYVGPPQPQYQQSYDAAVQPAYANSQMPTSYSTASVGTIRPSSTQPVAYGAADDPINALIRPMSSMSMSNMSAVASSQQYPMPPPTPYQNQPSSAPPPAGHPGPPAPYATPSTYAAPPPAPYQPYSAMPTTPSLPSMYSPAPTPPPGHAPPHHGYQESYAAYPPQSNIHPAQTFIPSHGSLASMPPPHHPAEPPRAQSPAVPPLRPLSTSGYHALPPVPGGQQGQPSGSRVSSPVPYPSVNGSGVNAPSMYQAMPAPSSTPDPYGRPTSPAAPMSSFTQPLPASYYAQQPHVQQTSVYPPRPTSPSASGMSSMPSAGPYAAQPGTMALPPAPPARRNSYYDLQHQQQQQQQPPYQRPVSPALYGQPPATQPPQSSFSQPYSSQPAYPTAMPTPQHYQPPAPSQQPYPPPQENNHGGPARPPSSTAYHAYPHSQPAPPAHSSYDSGAYQHSGPSPYGGPPSQGPHQDYQYDQSAPTYQAPPQPQQQQQQHSYAPYPPQAAPTPGAYQSAYPSQPLHSQPPPPQQQQHTTTYAAPRATSPYRR